MFKLKAGRSCMKECVAWLALCRPQTIVVSKLVETIPVLLRDLGDDVQVVLNMRLPGDVLVSVGPRAHGARYVRAQAGGPAAAVAGGVDIRVVAQAMVAPAAGGIAFRSVTKSGAETGRARAFRVSVVGLQERSG